ncbi:major facilitator superfamily domain-containing protein [Xylogone sp. PMI_703]|nr:major facilitator superfamily domain-containing protein [Xylogone sp. PMI_703]
MTDIPEEKESGSRTASPSVNTLAVPQESVQDTSERTSVTDVENEKGSAIDVDKEKQEQQAEQVEEKPPRDISGWRWIVVVLAILSSTFLFALDQTIVADVQPEIVIAFNSIGKLTWLSVAFLMTAASTNLIFGKIYTQFNAKWLYICTITLFELGSAVCGAAPNMNALIVGRALCGVGGVGMYVGVMTLIAATTTMHERPIYVAFTGLTWGLGTVLGPIIGGAFTDSSAGWRWAFYINLCVGGACAPVYLFMLPSPDPRPGVKFFDRLRELDWLGALLILGAFITGVTAISLGGITDPWNSGTIIGLFCASGVLFILFGLQQTFLIFTTKERRVMPIEFFYSRTLLILFAMTSAGGTAIFVPIYMIPLLFQFTRNDSALEAGVRLLPFIFLTVFAVILNGAILSSYGYYMPWYLGGGIMVVIGSALLYTVDQDTSTAKIYGYCVILGVGVGMFSQTSFSVAQAVVEPEMVPSAVGFITCAQVTGVTISLAISNSVFLNKSQSGIQAILPNVSASEVQSAIAGANSAFVKNLAPDVRTKVLDAIVTAMSKSYILVITAGSLVIVLSTLLKREKLFLQAGAAA